MKPRQRLLLNLRKYHYERIKPDSDSIMVDNVSKVLIVLNKKLKTTNITPQHNYQTEFKTDIKPLF